jgi:hypothetical protein
MTAAAKPPGGEFVEDGVTLTHPIDCRFGAGTIKATRFFADGSKAELVIGIDFGLTGGETDAGGTLAKASAGVAGTRLRWRRVTPRAQQINYATADTFPAERHESGLDIAMLIDQEQDVKIEDFLSRALLLPEGEAGFVFPGTAGRLGPKLFGFDPGGAPTLLDPGALAKGDPGGNALAVGLFTAVSLMNVAVGVDLIMTNGYSSIGQGVARYRYDVAVDAAYVAQNPRTSVRTSNGRGFRLAEPVITVEMLGAMGDGLTDDSAAINAALIFSAAEVQLLAKIYVVDNLQAVTGRVLRGRGSAQSVLKIKAGSVNNIITGAAVPDFVMCGVFLDYTGGGAGSGRGGFFSNCLRLILEDIYVKNAKGQGLWLYNCADHKLSHIVVDGAADWAIHVESAPGQPYVTTNGYASDLKTINCLSRGVYYRRVQNSKIDGVTGFNNVTTALWLDDCNYVTAFNVHDQNDVSGDSAVIGGNSVGTRIIGVTAVNSGGHGATCSSSPTGAPTDCHISHVYSEGQGESMAVISSQGEVDGLGNPRKPSNCTITNVSGRNCGRVLASEAFGIASAVSCLIQGRVLDTLGGMTRAAVESGAGSTNNRFEIDGWVSGSAGYFQIVSSSSTVEHRGLARGQELIGDANFAWNPALHRRQILYTVSPLTAARDVTLQPSWSGDILRVSRQAAGAFSLNIKQGAVTLKALAAGQWCDLQFDSVNWNITAAGTL